jgi:hypothetical protein
MIVLSLKRVVTCYLCVCFYLLVCFLVAYIHKHQKTLCNSYCYFAKLINRFLQLLMGSTTFCIRKVLQLKPYTCGLSRYDTVVAEHIYNSCFYSYYHLFFLLSLFVLTMLSARKQVNASLMSYFHSLKNLEKVIEKKK